MEAAIAASGRTLSNMTIDEMEREWQKAKSAAPDRHETHETTKHTKGS
jgi:hypothetical protein